eukprot:1406776-Pleurochrysis_carterae.AAC.2
MCVQKSSIQWTAVLGVLSTEERVAYRREARVSWMKRTHVRDSGILPLFVLRGLGATQAQNGKRHAELKPSSSLLASQ